MDWIDIGAYQRREDGGRVLTATIAGEVDIHVEASPHERDIRVADDEHIVRIRITPDWHIRDVLVDDLSVWDLEGGE